MGRVVGAVLRGVLSASLMVGAATALSLALGSNAVTAGFVYLISILLLAVWRGFIAGVVGSLLGTVCFNFFFFPPLHTLRIADPQNWVSLGCFLIATLIASRLVFRERERAAEAEGRKREIEALYELCLDLFTAPTMPSGLTAATRRALDTIGAQGGGLVLFGETPAGQGEDWIGSFKDLEMHRLLGGGQSETPPQDGKRWRNARVPVSVGDRQLGWLVAYGTRARVETLESIAKLISLALERERLLAEQARLEALKASDSFKTALLQAVSHDLSTPLTAVLVSIASLKRAVSDRAETAETIELIAAETARLHRRIQNLLDLARLEAHGAKPQREPTPPADLFRAARENLPHITATRRIEARVAPECQDLDVDPSLALEILVNLVENAHRASPAGAPIDLVARVLPGDPDRILLEVLDRGKGLTHPAADSMPEDTPRKGLGLEIARSFAAALDGAVSLHPREGGGACARVELPAARLLGAGHTEGA
ncbi:MAG TPA: DUF4118 domain-containing protein [Candidatus Polarisedimenticolia bacterium]|nr:DUF4118 domain-containing protein [Candidatus Polarisedimenticolia bacterium]